MDASTYEKTVRDKFTALFEKNKSVGNIYEKLRKGTATYEDANKFGKEISSILSTVVDETVTDRIVNEEAKTMLYNMIGQNVELVSAVCDAVQSNLNTLAEISIKPISPNKSRIKDRMGGIIKSIDDKTPIKEVIRSGETLTLSVVDEWVQTNAEFQAKAGLSPVIVRKWDGTWGSHDTRHTDFCSRLQGVYEYPVSDRRVFQRHKGCQCVISYYPNKKAQGIITALAKGEKDTEGILRTATASTKSKYYQLQRQTFGEAESKKIINKEWGEIPVENIAKNIESGTQKIKEAIGTEYADFVGTLNNSKSLGIKNVFSKHSDKIKKLVNKGNSGKGEYSRIWDTIDFSIPNKPGSSRFNVLTHEYGHFFDEVLKDSSLLTYDEISKLHTIRNGEDIFGKVASSSDQYLAALRKDIKHIDDAFSYDDIQALRKVENSGGIQDAMDGIYGIRLQHYHGSAYYERAFNNLKVGKSTEKQKQLQALYKEMGFDASNLGKTKKISRNYETASELWANQTQTLATGGVEEVELMQKWFPNTFSLIEEIMVKL